MKRKLLSLAASLLLVAPIAASAAPSPSQTPGGTVTGYGDKEVLITGSEKDLDLEIPVIVIQNAATASDADSKAVIAKKTGSDEAFLNAVENGLYAKALKDLGNVKKATVAAIVYDITCNQLAKDLLTSTLTATVNEPGIKAGDTVVVYHVKGGKVIETLKGTAGNGTVSFPFTTASLSPFIIVKADKDAEGGEEPGGKTPNTSDNNASMLWGSIAMISFAAAVGIIVTKRRNA